MARSGRAFKAPRPYNRPDKGMFEDFAKENGLNYTIERVDVGAWNERREWKLDGEIFGSTFKGDTVDWFDLMVCLANAANIQSMKENVAAMRGNF
ncbi:hypothetical protein SXAG_00136 [Synechococcus phage S-CBS4]|nr:hypothetical protein SXAG_00136 [Synechococcus phage S-CBS4]